VDAQIFTSTDGVALDTIFVSRAFDLDEDELRRADRIALGIERALCGEIRLQDIVAAKTGSRKERSRSAFHVHPDVTIDNNLSVIFSVVEVSGLDRPGLLYELTTILSRLDLNIGSAHIVTFGEKMVDVFYITDFAGAKITSATRQSVIKRQLLKAFSASETTKKDELEPAPAFS
jgi:[protein-PII] uridylyltransferase